MRKSSPRPKKDRRGSLLACAVLSSILIAVCVSSVYAFKVGVGAPLNWPAVHEGITDVAVTGVVGSSTNAIFRANVASGVFNTDFSHQTEHAFHFDSSTMSNTHFDDGFNNLNLMLTDAKWQAILCDPQCRINPMFVSPNHSSYRDLAESLVGTYLQLSTNGACFWDWACPTSEFAADAAAIQTEILPMLIDSDPDPDPLIIASFNNNSQLLVANLAPIVSDVKGKVDTSLGPHCGSDGNCYNRLEDILTDDQDFQQLAQYLRQLQQEYQAYYAWQHLGHALHSTQDFFAHSNYVELASGKHGPVCSFSSPLCDTAIAENQVPTGALPLPTDGPIGNLQTFDQQFSKSSVGAVLDRRPRIFADANSSHLQTGYFDLDDFFNPCHSGPPRTADNYQYCHYPNSSSSTPGMNKDESAGTGDNEPNYANFDYAVASATRVSVVLLASFFNDLPGGSAFVAPGAAQLAQPSGSMPGTGKFGGIAHINGIAFGNLQIPRNIILAPPTIVAPHKIYENGPIARPAITGIASIAIPTIARHAFIRVSPGKVFRPGEHAQVIIEAFDKQTGDPIANAPVEIETVRGVTFKPIALTVELSQQQRCGAIQGQRFCLNRLVPPPGHVQLPAGYPPADGNFIIPTIVPQLLVEVPNQGLLQGPGSALTVFVRDAQTHNLVRTGTLLAAGAPIGPVNRTIIHKLAPVGTLRLRTKPELQNTAARLGPPLIVRVPGYSDELVRYAIAAPR